MADALSMFGPGSNIPPTPPKDVAVKSSKVCLLPLEHFGCTSHGSNDSVKGCIQAIIAYINTIGGGGQNATCSMIGNRYWTQSTQQCVNVDQGGYVTADKYFNNVPAKDNPFGQSLLGLLAHISKTFSFTALLDQFMGSGAEKCKNVALNVDYQNEDGSTVSSTQAGNLTCSNLKMYTPEMWAECGLSDAASLQAELCGATEGMVGERGRSNAEQTYHAGLAFVGLYIISRLLLPRIDRKSKKRR